MFSLHFINNIFSEHMLMVASVNETLDDEIDYHTSFYFCNQFLKWNRMLVKQKVIGVFKKKQKKNNMKACL